MPTGVHSGEGVFLVQSCHLLLCSHMMEGIGTSLEFLRALRPFMR